MQHAADLLRMAGAQNIQSILVSVPIMDDQRLTQLASQLDVPDNKRLLFFGRSIVPILIQTRFSHSHHLRMM